MSSLPTLLGVHLLALMTPGPDFLLVSRTAISASRRAAVLAAVGIVLGVMFWAAAALVGLHILLEKIFWLQAIVKLGGGAYLIYLGSLMLRSAPAQASTPIATEATANLSEPALVRHQALPGAAALRSGFLTNMANPKAAIYFGSVFANFIGPTTTAAGKALIFACVALESLLWFLVVATLFSSPWVQRVFGRAQLWIDRVAGVAFVLLGLRLMLSLGQ